MNTRLFASFLSLAVLLGVAPRLSAADSAPGCSQAAPAASNIVARIGDQVLTEEQMKKEIAGPLFEAENQVYMAKRNWIDSKTKDILFAEAAKAANLPLDQWISREISSKVTPPTDVEVDAFLQKMARGQIPTDPAKLAEMKSQAQGYILSQKRTTVESELLRDLKAKSKVEINLVTPIAPRVEINVTAASPVKGPKNAPVTIYEFTDFQCPWCSRAQEPLHAVVNANPGKIKVITRNFPLSQIHPRAWPAAEAAACVNEQGKFWEYHDKLFANQQALGDDDLLKYAKEVGVNEKKFQTCVKEHRYKSLVEADQAEGQRVGVSGTPTFFVNGIKTNFNQIADNVRAELEKK